MNSKTLSGLYELLYKLLPKVLGHRCGLSSIKCLYTKWNSNAMMKDTQNKTNLPQLSKYLNRMVAA